MAHKERWATRLGLVLAMAGNAVGLGNFLRFPAQAAANGGGAFLIPYLVALLVMGLPLMWVEWAMGRYGGQRGHHSAPGVFQSMGRSPFWKYFGIFGLWTNLIVAAYYLYIESWCFVYAGYSYMGGFLKESPSQFFGRLTGSVDNEILAISLWGLGAFFVCIVLNIWILSRGLAKGIEVVAKIGMPLLIVFAAILAVRGLMIEPGDVGVFKDPKTGEAATPWLGLNFVWEPKYDSLLNPATWLAAAGQIFFTLSIGMGTIHCYASYLREDEDVALTGTTTAFTNEFCEIILGGTILIPIAVAYLGLAKVQEMTGGGSGLGLGFFVFPTLFNNWGEFGPFAGFLWFGLLFFAAITSSLAMGQPIMAFFQQEFNMSRERSAVFFGLLLLPLAGCAAIFTMGSFFDEFDYWAGTVALVIFALVESILFAWVFGMERGWAEILKGAELRIPRLFYYVIKYVTPVFLILILIGVVFLPEGKTIKRNDKGEIERLADGSPALEEQGWGGYVLAPLRGDPLPEWRFSKNSLIGKLMHYDLRLPPPPKLQADTPEARREHAEAMKKYQVASEFNENLKTARNADRLVMVGVFAFFGVLVAIAWNRRRAEGRA